MRIIAGKARGTKLYTLEGETTRPTLDRVKESIFNIIQNELDKATFLDLFAGSGAIGLEAASRGATEVIMCDKSKEAINIIKKNIEKTHLQEQTKIYQLDYIELLQKLNKKIDIIYIDPPYKSNYIQETIKIILENNLIHKNSKIILETDDINRIKKEIEEFRINIIDTRKYGRANILFLKSENNNI